MNTSRKPISINAVASLACAFVALIAFLLLQWFHISDASYTGWELVRDQVATTFSGTSYLFLIPFVAILAGLFSTIAFARYRWRVFSAAYASVLGGAGLFYFVLFYIRSAVTAFDTLTVTGIGFWITLIALIGLFAQGMVFQENDPSINIPVQPIVTSSRVDRVGMRPRIGTSIRALIAIAIAILMLIPVAWMGLTAFKSRPDAIASPPKLFFTPTLEGFVSLLTDRRQLTNDEIAQYQQRTDLSWIDQIALVRGQLIIGQSEFPHQLMNSVIIAGISTFFSVGFGVLAAYAFSRFNIPGKDDLLFFILSQRMLPAVVVTIPIFLMYREVGLHDTYFGMILLYTSFNLSFSVWLLKGFIDEIPREYEEAALVDGYTRLQAFRKIVLPQAITGIAATTVFALIFSWNEYAFALMLTSDNARTAPPSIPTRLGTGGIEWAAIAAGSLAFLIPVVIVTFALRKHLLRGVTFGAIRKG